MKSILTIFLFFFLASASGQVKKLSMGENIRRTSIYPNPARSFIRIQFQPSIPPPSSLVIYNFLGKKQVEVNQPGSNVFIDLAEFNRGIYIFQFRDKNGQILATSKFQVEK
jgi:hypothetical protein